VERLVGAPRFSLTLFTRVRGKRILRTSSFTEFSEVHGPEKWPPATDVPCRLKTKAEEEGECLLRQIGEFEAYHLKHAIWLPQKPTIENNTPINVPKTKKKKPNKLKNSG
jgi:hypothetical protein